jgi:hypothetical protein
MKAPLGILMAAAVAGTCFISTGAKPASALAAPAAYVQEGGWEAPPGELDEIQRRGFRDGIEGARKDFGNHRSPDPHNREEFRHPPVHGRAREAYRRGFERGYQVGVEHLYHEHR